ncbi:hypothetical protein CAI21_10835 [Alkalilimnicola ehrlichii]|uniref:DUF1611 domain-containing protein n=1 Tax=Alkalilimnicola ehrlichii TaxID=351052 RepID=A0A3E0WUT7_9GAMM|nr:hypothetical protein [Alkalilimnicola ehrlichii]RFA29249.1 hypothetical protein CAI21_10835 [Alkalilimnicola ehrlichii]RFA36159.1 hypothetical protein CAL65_11980 [Alkalilimnicola ehrlichii]
MGSTFYSSVTRISDLAESAWAPQTLDFEHWQTGHYVVVRITRPSGRPDIELANGRMSELMPGDTVVGALGVRHATLESVGDWRAVGVDREMDLLTAGGLLGRVTSCSPFAGPITRGDYLGHVVAGGAPVSMGDFVQQHEPKPLAMPVVLIIGTSMSAGKTLSARLIVRRLRELGRVPVAAKFTGAGRYRDILSMADAGAEAVFDFVDVGLPSTVCSDAEYRAAFEQLSARIAATRADVLVAEAGASPLEPYQGALAVAGLVPTLCFTVLAASDPYAVLGVTQAFKLKPDVVTGPATNTLAGEELIKKLTGLEPLNLFQPQGLQRLDRLIEERVNS